MPSRTNEMPLPEDDSASAMSPATRAGPATARLAAQMTILDTRMPMNRIASAYTAP
nr:hypothetical protein [Georgenia satyanarayanai]